MKHFTMTSMAALILSGMVMAQSPTPQTPPSRESQSSSQASDTQMAAKVHEAIQQDSTLASAAQNVRVTARSGMVTLRGKVSTEEEKTAIVAKAKQIAGDSNVKDEITVSKSK